MRFESSLLFSLYVTRVNVYIYLSGIPPLHFALATSCCDIREECRHIPDVPVDRVRVWYTTSLFREGVLLVWLMMRDADIGDILLPWFRLMCHVLIFCYTVLVLFTWLNKFESCRQTSMKAARNG